MVSISAINSGLKTVWKYGKRALEVAPELAFGTASEATGAAMKATKGSIFKKAEAGWKALEKAGSGNFFKRFLTNAKDFFPEAIKAFNAGQGLKGKFGSLFKNLGSKMPFIMSATWMLMEAPNVYTAIKEQGLFQGVKEVLKFGARMTTAGLGSAIGSAIPIPGGSIIGWMVGEWVASRIVGKSYTEQKAEKEELIKELVGQDQNVQQPVDLQTVSPNPYWINNPSATPYQQTQPQVAQQPSFNGMSNPFDYNQYKLQSVPYADDIMMKNMPFNMVA